MYKSLSYYTIKGILNIQHIKGKGRSAKTYYRLQSGLQKWLT